MSSCNHPINSTVQLRSQGRINAAQSAHDSTQLFSIEMTTRRHQPPNHSRQPYLVYRFQVLDNNTLDRIAMS
ncbi:hypothetical protein D3C76_894560 [compost metagenome]